MSGHFGFLGLAWRVFQVRKGHGTVRVLCPKVLADVRQALNVSVTTYRLQPTCGDKSIVVEVSCHTRLLT